MKQKKTSSNTQHTSEEYKDNMFLRFVSLAVLVIGFVWFISALPDKSEYCSTHPDSSGCVCTGFDNESVAFIDNKTTFCTDINSTLTPLDTVQMEVVHRCKNFTVLEDRNTSALIHCNENNETILVEGVQYRILQYNATPENYLFCISFGQEYERVRLTGIGADIKYKTTMICTNARPKLWKVI